MSRHHQAIKNDPRWHAARAACFARDGYACVTCGSTEDLRCDHVIPLSIEPSLAFDLDNLQTLCETHNNEKGDAIVEQIRITWTNPKYDELAGFLSDDSARPRGLADSHEEIEKHSEVIL